uniref:Uncharacterized protein n=1 Tax=Oryza sativa subsp. japonica TaxID=39947 RepID=Q75LH7_ORYSJ|nr:hypothetical protein [Oryza sativa Japonica Group]
MAEPKTAIDKELVVLADASSFQAKPFELASEFESPAYVHDCTVYVHLGKRMPGCRPIARLFLWEKLAVAYAYARLVWIGPHVTHMHDLRSRNAQGDRSIELASAPTHYTHDLKIEILCSKMHDVFVRVHMSVTKSRVFDRKRDVSGVFVIL